MKNHKVEKVEMEYVKSDLNEIANSLFRTLVPVKIRSRK